MSRNNTTDQETMASQEEVDEVFIRIIVRLGAFPGCHPRQYSRVWRTPYEKLMRRPLARPSAAAVSNQSVTGLGILNNLPSDILVPTLESLDFQSLSRFAQTSAAANNLVQALPAYEQVMKHA